MTHFKTASWVGAFLVASIFVHDLAAESVALYPREDVNEVDHAAACARGAHADQPKTQAAPNRRGFTVRYFTGVSHSFYRLMVRGHRDEGDSSVPPASGYYHEFLYDGSGRLAFVIGHPVNGEPYVSDQIVYSNDGPFARLTYGPEGLQFGDYVYYKDGRAKYACRVIGDRVGLVETVKEAAAD